MNRFRLLICFFAAQYILGCAYISSDPQLHESPSRESLANANQQGKPIKRILQTKKFLLDSLPVGSIVAYFPSDDLVLPENWRYCDGSIVQDLESVYNGSRLPDLIDNRFLMGSLSQFGVYGGDNLLEESGVHVHQIGVGASGDHNHTGLTGVEENNGVVKEMHQAGEINVRITEQGHKHIIENSGTHRHNIQVDSSGLHDHGGDSRPKFFGILYIIKIK